MEKEELQKYLASVIKCEETKNSSIEHEWLLFFKADAVKIANYLRGHGYKAVVEERHPVGVKLFYVGVPFKTLVS